MVEIDIDKIAKEKCGIELIKKNATIVKLMKELNNTNDAAKIMVLCDKVTDEIRGYNTDGFFFSE